MLEGKSAIELLEFSPTACERSESFPQYPGREPTFGCDETLESLNCFEPAIQLLVHTFNEIGGSGTIDVQQRFGFHVGCELLATLEDMLHDGDL